MSFPRYPNLGTASTWLGIALPASWSESKASRLIACGMGQTILKEMVGEEDQPGWLPVYSASEGEEVFGYLENPLVRLESGDLVIGARGSIGKTRQIERPSTCTQTTIWAKVSSAELDSRYLYWVFVGLRERLFPCDKTAIPMLTVEQVRSGRIPMPPSIDQAHIVNFLDRETAKIDALIAEQQRLIELLQEKRQAVISHAVTKGLNPDAPMKDSGVEWLGEVPEHWEVAQMRRYIQKDRKITYGIVQPGEPDPAGRFMVRGQDYSTDWSPPDSIFRVSPIIEEPYARSRLKAGDLVMTIVGAGVGNTAKAPDWLDGANITQTTCRIAVEAQATNPDYMKFVLESSVGRYSIGFYAKGAAQPGLNLEHVKMFPVTCPPLDEQTRIARYLAESLCDVDDLIQQSLKASTLLQERRSALISAAVTGQIDVRGLVSEEAA